MKSSLWLHLVMFRLRFLLFREQGAVIDCVEGRTDLARGAVKNRKASGSTQESGSIELARQLPAASVFSREDRDHK